ncbi:DUF438 domain-containing protein [Chitinispirillales bacterium ANBcel5]|uniref:DUF438 domain-containing protein n=1 Tax=Cellulosispirillum alkaliphilum TaxID=3039283 RepID=UPI002A5669C4|nr:DUF438 domain-containing protein [Chitinispirillales bacterium ANBcel5]
MVLQEILTIAIDYLKYELIEKIALKIEKETGESVTRFTTFEGITDSQARHEILKEVFRDLHAGADIRSVKRLFKELIQDIDASEISKIEQ